MPNWLILAVLAVAYVAVSVPGWCRALRRAADTCTAVQRDTARREGER